MVGMHNPYGQNLKALFVLAEALVLRWTYIALSEDDRIFTVNEVNDGRLLLLTSP